MKRNVLGLSMIALALCAGTALTAAAQNQVAQPAKQTEAQVKPLGVGDPAPALKVGKWIKGSEIKSFEKGKVYVVEGWATWCGPCKVSIPHLTEMAHKNKDKATFIGVSVWENAKPAASESAYQQRVADFVQEMSDKMDYTVAIDTVSDNSGHVAKNWLKAAGQDGIPSAFIINGEGKIAWIGHPMQMEKVLDQVVAGTWDMEAAIKAGQKDAENAAKERAAREKQMADMKPVLDAVKAKDYAAAAKAYDALIAKYPENATALKLDKFTKLLVGDPTIAYATAKGLADNEFKNDAQGLNELAWSILDNKKLANPDYNLALSFAQKAADLTNNQDGMILDSVALAQFKLGKIDDAIKTQTKALENVKGAPEPTIKEMKARLEEFKAAKK